MYCSKCGSQNVNGERFCKTCGTLLENNQPQQTANNMNGQVQQPMNQQYTNTNGNLDPNYVNQAVNPNMKKWAILSIVVPVAGIIWYWFIGLSFYLAIFIATAGFGFAQKGQMADKKLATIGKVCNGVLVGMAVIMFVLQLIGIFAQ